jgi:hypothetical protein
MTAARHSRCATLESVEIFREILNAKIRFFWPSYDKCEFGNDPASVEARTDKSRSDRATAGENAHRFVSKMRFGERFEVPLMRCPTNEEERKAARKAVSDSNPSFGKFDKIAFANLMFDHGEYDELEDLKKLTIFEYYDVQTVAKRILSNDEFYEDSYLDREHILDSATFEADRLNYINGGFGKRFRSECIDHPCAGDLFGNVSNDATGDARSTTATGTTFNRSDVRERKKKTKEPAFTSAVVELGTRVAFAYYDKYYATPLREFYAGEYVSAYFALLRSFSRSFSDPDENTVRTAVPVRFIEGYECCGEPEFCSIDAWHLLDALEKSSRKPENVKKRANADKEESSLILKRFISEHRASAKKRSRKRRAERAPGSSGPAKVPRVDRSSESRDAVANWMTRFTITGFCYADGLTKFVGDREAFLVLKRNMMDCPVSVLPAHLKRKISTFLNVAYVSVSVGKFAAESCDDVPLLFSDDRKPEGANLASLFDPEGAERGSYREWKKRGFSVIRSTSASKHRASVFKTHVVTELAMMWHAREIDSKCTKMKCKDASDERFRISKSSSLSINDNDVTYDGTSYLVETDAYFSALNAFLKSTNVVDEKDRVDLSSAFFKDVKELLEFRIGTRVPGFDVVIDAAT